jgi:membrane protein implicated in regulation of membrane protease activity
MDERQISGYIMATVGFVMILMNALSYLFGWDLKSPAFTILGLVLIVIGTKTARKISE